MKLEDRCRRAVLKIAEHVKDIDQKLNHFLENYKADLYAVHDEACYQKALNRPPKYS